MSRTIKLIVSSVLVLLFAGVFFLNMSQKTESLPRFAPTATLDPSTRTPTPKPGDTPIPGARETLQAQIAAQRPESQYDKITDLSPEMPLKDKYTLVLQHPDGSLEAILMRPDMQEEQWKKIDPNDLIVTDLPPASSFVVGPMEPPANFDKNQEQSVNIPKDQHPMVAPPVPTELMVPYATDDYSEDQEKVDSVSSSSSQLCCPVFLPQMQK